MSGRTNILRIMKNYYSDKIAQYTGSLSEAELSKYAQETALLDNLRRYNLGNLYNNISAKIKKVFGKKFLESANSGIITAEESINANINLAKDLYSDHLANLILNHNIKQFEDLSDDNLRKFVSENKSTLSNFLESKGVQFLVIRPEMHHLHQVIEEFLEREGLKIIYSIDKTLSFEQYWAIYKDNLIDKNSFADFPTRTLVYLSGKCRIIVILKSKNVDLSKIKGERGVYIPHTIRGDLITKESLYLLKGGIVDAKKLYFILDPIGSYRNIVSGDIPSDGIHKEYMYPFLFYAIAGIHTPENDEVRKELQVLLSLDEIKEITKRVLSKDLNERVKSLDFISSGESLTYSVDLGEKRNYLKIGKEGRSSNFVFEAHALKLLNNHAANVSTPIDYGSDYLLQSEVKGESINDKPKLFLKQCIYDDLAKDLNKFYSLNFDKFGRVGLNGNTGKEFCNWEDFFDEIDIWVHEISKNDLVERSLVDYLYKIWISSKWKIAKISEPHLVHGDFCLDHIYSSDGQYSGIIDFGDSFAGDPLMDLAYFKYKEITKDYGAKTYKLLIDAYSKFRKFSKHEKDLVDLYMIYWGLRRVHEAMGDGLILKFTEKLSKLGEDIYI
ncbi:MAG: Phosphotransferase enzyme family protein [candidate division WS2 bacterium ADurb.Bin280]|uniref:Phosphotransferase enzyme family protein n=1 Tax=candidate division WS2 bacterium ADurb.Bin280 TaxID=1852829 RepID=A0A1V5SEI9_9BACT|nr:MAG: Phosphotransferase enzyme family protein [candidate division WS2 bacterium ADurb.Bin280]